MQQILKIFDEVTERKIEKKEINRHIRESLLSSKEYSDIKDKMLNLKSREKQLKEAAKEPYAERLDLLTLAIKDGEQNLSDVALNQILKGERVEIVDKPEGRFEPVFSVKFKKAK